MSKKNKQFQNDQSKKERSVEKKYASEECCQASCSGKADCSGQCNECVNRENNRNDNCKR